MEEDEEAAEVTTQQRRDGRGNRWAGEFEVDGRKGETWRGLSGKPLWMVWGLLIPPNYTTQNEVFIYILCMYTGLVWFLA